MFFTACVPGLRKVYPYYFTFTTFTKGRWVGEKILEVFAREFRAHPAEEYERCIRAGTLTVNYQKVDVDYRLRHNDLLANVVHRYVLVRSFLSVPFGRLYRASRARAREREIDFRGPSDLSSRADHRPPAVDGVKASRESGYCEKATSRLARSLIESRRLTISNAAAAVAVAVEL